MLPSGFAFRSVEAFQCLQGKECGTGPERRGGSYRIGAFRWSDLQRQDGARVSSFGVGRGLGGA